MAILASEIVFYKSTESNGGIDSLGGAKTSTVITSAQLHNLFDVVTGAESTAGATSWIKLGIFKIQPSEFCKFTTSLALAKMFSLNKQKRYSFIRQED